MKFIYALAAVMVTVCAVALINFASAKEVSREAPAVHEHVVTTCFISNGVSRCVSQYYTAFDAKVKMHGVFFDYETYE